MTEKAKTKAKTTTTTTATKTTPPQHRGTPSQEWEFYGNN
jgi:hypothetical protein